MFRLDGKVALVTGAGSGIGQATALTLARQGAFVAIFDLNPQAAADTLTQIQAAGGQGSIHIANVASLPEMQSEVAQLNATHGHVDILVNSAGVSHIGTVETTSEEDFDRLYTVNVKGTFHAMKAAIPFMKAQGKGSIVNLASIASVVGIADRFAYSMTKGAVLTMTLSAARDYISAGIRVNCISPGRVHTPFVDNFLKNNYPGQEAEVFAKLAASQPIGRMGTPAEMAALILYLVSDEAGFVTGANYDIDGGFIGVRM